MTEPCLSRSGLCGPGEYAWATLEEPRGYLCHRCLKMVLHVWRMRRIVNSELDGADVFTETQLEKRLMRLGILLAADEED